VTSALAPILDTVLDGTWKGFPQDHPPLRLGDVGAQGWNVLRGDLGAVALVLRGPALDHNQRWMGEFLRRTGTSFCPHGKTTMAPQLFHRQLADGAWGITVATAQQARVAVEVGVPRILLANELSHPGDVRWLQAALDRDPRLDAMVLVDSVAAVELLAREARGRRPLPVLVELGWEGGRTGARTVAEALAVARAARAAPRVQLRGVECFEGLIQSDDAAADAARVSALLAALWDLAAACAAEGLVEAGELVVTAGGSAYFDLVALAAERGGGMALPTRVVLRSGCTLTHDSGMYERAVARLEARLPERWRGPRSLEPALEVWSRVVSRPEPGLALLAMGKRDVAHDVDLPRPVRWARPAEAVARAAPEGWSVFRLNDQHAYLEISADAPLAPGDLVGCGISHPCTTFDRWTLLFLVDGGYAVTEAVRTFF